MDDHDRRDAQTEREHALPEHETRPTDEGADRSTATELDLGDPDEPAIDPSEGPPPVNRSG